MWWETTKRTHLSRDKKLCWNTSIHRLGITVFQNNNPIEPQKETINVTMWQCRSSQAATHEHNRRQRQLTTRQRTGNCSQIAVDDNLLSNLTVKYCLKSKTNNSRCTNTVSSDTSRHANETSPTEWHIHKCWEAGAYRLRAGSSREAGW